MMKLLLMLLPLAFLMPRYQESVKPDADYSYELTVDAKKAEEPLFNLSITGHTLAPNGEKTSFRMERKNEKAPFRYHLKNGQYVIRVESLAEKGALVTKVQGRKEGKEMGSASNDGKKTILKVWPGGSYAASEE
jgi:hypothetical protein